jgi:PhnB protein
MQVQPYLSFEGRCDEAIAFYKKALGAEVQMVMRFKDAPAGACPGGTQPPGDKVMHSALRVGDTTVMMSDGRCSGKPTFAGINLSLDAKDDAQAQTLFNALSADGGTVGLPLNKTFFASSFGMVTDRFGVTWMIFAGAQ